MFDSYLLTYSWNGPVTTVTVSADVYAIVYNYGKDDQVTKITVTKKNTDTPLYVIMCDYHFIAAARFAVTLSKAICDCGEKAAIMRIAHLVTGK